MDVNSIKITIPITLTDSPELPSHKMNIHDGRHTSDIQDSDTKVKIGSFHSCFGRGIDICIKSGDSFGYTYYIDTLTLWQAVKDMHDKTIGLREAIPADTMKNDPAPINS